MKRLLPLAAIGVLSSLVIWPWWAELHGSARVSYHVVAGSDGANQSSMRKARFRGNDDNGNPYTVTANQANQVDQDTTLLTQPAGDLLRTGNDWMMVTSRFGIYHTKSDLLDLSDHVELYRNDGTIIRTSSAQIDTKTDGVDGRQTVQASGPFGTIKGTGFSLTDKGTHLMVLGPAIMRTKEHP